MREDRNQYGVPKRAAIRSQKLKAAANGEACTVCGVNDGTTVLAHLNEPWAGKGMGLKADDIAGIMMCVKCHDRYDGRNNSQTLSDYEILRALYRTMRRWIEMGLIKIA